MEVFTVFDPNLKIFYLNSVQSDDYTLIDDGPISIFLHF